MSKLPPVPPANRSPAGNPADTLDGGATPGTGKLPENEAQANIDSKNRQLEQQGRQGNTWQNTRHPGYQQDR